MNASNGFNHEISEVEMLNSLLGYQQAAVQTYDQALLKLEDPHVLADLHMIREEHAQAETLLRQKVQELGGKPDQASGHWGACAEAISSEENAMGLATALAALRQGEEHSINEFEETLKHQDLNPDCKNLIRSQLLPATRKHVAELNRLMGGM